MTPLGWSNPTDEELPKRSVLQHLSERALALLEQLLPVGDEQEGRSVWQFVMLLGEPAVIQGCDDGLARPCRCDD